MGKPFNPHELVARVKAILRRGNPIIQGLANLIRIGDLTIDPPRFEVNLHGQRIDLKNQEFNLLVELVKHKGLVLSREQILNLAWGYDYVGESRTVDVHIGHLRRKLAGSSVRIETITGVGYKLVV
jgi:DNA-binding response OmpR family regulator